MHDLLELPAIADATGVRGVDPRPSSRCRVPFLGRAVAAALGLCAVVVGQMAHVPLLVLAGLVLSLAACLLRSTPFWLALPAALVLLLVLAILLGTGAALLDVDLLQSRTALRCTQLFASGALLLRVLTDRPAPSRVDVPLRGSSSAAIALPAAAAAVVALLQGVGGRSRSWALTGTDIAEHVRLLGETQVAGHLSYDVSPYPQGWHTLLALATTSDAPPRSGALLLQDIDLYVGSLWLVFALVLLLAAGLAHELTRLSGARSHTPAVAALLTGTALLTSVWVQETFLQMGSAPTLVVVLALWWLTAETGLRRPGPVGALRVLAVALVATVAAAHSWQGLALVPAAGFAAWALTRAARQDLRTLAATRHLAPLASGLIALLGLLSVQPVLALLEQSSVGSIASLEGALAGPSLRLVAVCLLLPPVWRLSGVGAGGAAALGAWAAIVGLVGLLLVTSAHPTDVHQYYPLKAASVLALCAAPWCAALGVIWWTRWTRALLSAPAAARLRPALLAGVGVGAALVLAGLVGPGVVRADSLLHQNLTGSIADNVVGARRLDLALTHARVATVIVPAGVGIHAEGDYPAGFVTSKLAGFLTGQPVFSGRTRFVCDHVDLARPVGRPLVLSELPRGDVLALMRREGCADVEVLQVPAADAVSAAALTAELTAD